MASSGAAHNGPGDQQTDELCCEKSANASRMISEHFNFHPKLEDGFKFFRNQDNVDNYADKICLCSAEPVESPRDASVGTSGRGMRIFTIL